MRFSIKTYANIVTIAELALAQYQATNSFKLLLLVHKFFIGLAPQYFREMLLIKCEKERLLHLKFMNTASGKRSFEYTSCRLWNRLPREIRMLNDSGQFKSNIKTVLFANKTIY